jgi:hypothetical protein
LSRQRHDEYPGHLRAERLNRLQRNYLAALVVQDAGGEVLILSDPAFDKDQIAELFRQHPNAVAIIATTEYTFFSRERGVYPIGDITIRPVQDD